jgi:predicted permease
MRTLNDADNPAGSELEVHFKPETGKAVIEGKTAVSFQNFVQLVLQKKVLPLCKTWGRDPIVVSSELLTSLASAPQDSQENRSGVVLVAFIGGALAGILALALVQLGLVFAGIPFGWRELAIVAGSILGVLLLLYVLIKMQHSIPTGEKFLETMEHVSSVLSTKK